MNTKSTHAFFLSSAILACATNVQAIVMPPPPSVVEANMQGDDVDANTEFSSESTTVIAPPPPSETEESPLTLTASLGYDSFYAQQGLVTSSAITKKGVFTFDCEGNWSTNSGINLFAQFQYGAIVEKIEDGIYDPFSFKIGMKDELFPNLHAVIDYRMHFDGLSGLYSRTSGKEGFVMEVNMGFRYDFIPSGFFVQIDYTPAIAGITGISFTFTAGYQYEINERLSCTLAAQCIYSWGFWEKEGLNAINIKLDLPYTPEDSPFTIIPFASCNWVGETGLDINRKYDEQLFKPFALIAGLRIQYTF